MRCCRDETVGVDLPLHQSVLLHDAVAGVAPCPSGGVYLDATFGGGGHSRALLERIGPEGCVVALDRDAEAIARGRALAAAFPGRLTLVHAPFSRAEAVLAGLGTSRLAGALFDLGVSSPQLDDPGRGFSFRGDGPLDMRMDRQEGQTAAELVNTMSVEELADLIYRYGEERHSRRVARLIGLARKEGPIRTTQQLAAVVAAAVPRSGDGLHPATRTFQALRIAVNRELDELAQGLAAAMSLLVAGGRLAVISFHSLEDRMVKWTFREAAAPLLPGAVERGAWQVLTRKPVIPDLAAVAANPRARSAKMRLIAKISDQAPRVTDPYALLGLPARNHQDAVSGRGRLALPPAVRR